MTETTRPERMAAFFDARSGGYDEHMAQSVDAFATFYRHVARPIAPTEGPLRVLDLGCGTGLELAPIFARAPQARVTGVDLSAQMLRRLRDKYAERRDRLDLVQGSYLEVSLGAGIYDVAVSVMTLHHLLPEVKQRLYGKIRRALRPQGFYVEGDWVVAPEKERDFLQAYGQRVPAGAEAGAFHVDVPLALATQRQLLRAAGFARVDVIWHEEEAAVTVAHLSESGVSV